MSDLLLRLTIRDMVPADLPGLAWSGDPGHLKAVAEMLELASAGEAENLLVCLPSGGSVAKCALRYDENPGAGTLIMFSVHGLVQSCGIGTALIVECERRILTRGLSRAEIGVETDNPRAQALYERLGYVEYARKLGGWNYELPDGSTGRYETMLVDLNKQLVPARDVGGSSDLLLGLTIRDLGPADLPGPWAPYPGHVEAVIKVLDRVPSGGAECVTACLPSGVLVGKGVIDYEQDPGAGTLTMFDVEGLLHSCGIGTALVEECERRIRARGVRRIEIGAETNNPRAQALYERLGYVEYARKPGGWDQQLPDGTFGRYETTIVHLRKEFSE
ncbi:GNAT family N-acetyltransferase [Tenggerimyces flavus]|uniref:GNAT family N-acetyltransferase n=1 Tax=Tenggerimyces flavus TaxID=1708749 RepID=A0ABV7YH48_9ACTN|nr:GNAT family N-acetyltransferase [Tenggerimyces flavus]MBM7788139.1 ribosomal protein S18 acetylase RimI-like enzyme [Tenggerimyces flavus]